MEGSSANSSAHHATDLNYDTMDNQALAWTDQARQHMQMPDSELMIQMCQHNEDALAELYDRYGALIYSIALGTTRDQAVAETVVLDVFQAVWLSASSFMVGVNVRVWLIGMTWRKAQHVRHMKA